jgi:rare lipoprotein A
MRLQRPGFRFAAFRLTFFGTIALMGCQQLATTTLHPAGSPAVSHTPSVAFEARELRTTTFANAALLPANAPMVAAAVPSGQFEDVYTPPAAASAATPAPRPEPEQEIASAPAPSQGRLFESGIASTYGEGDGFEGNRTACGQIFRTALVQVAHKTLPCGTMIRVEDTTTGKSVVAEVTDRGPYIGGRVVDLSWGAFEQLDPKGAGLREVAVYLLDD